jgi:hypothetical protein
LAGALQVIGCSQRSAAAAAEFREATLAVTTRPVMDSYTKALVSLAKAGGYAERDFSAALDHWCERAGVPKARFKDAG